MPAAPAVRGVAPVGAGVGDASAGRASAAAAGAAVGAGAAVAGVAMGGPPAGNDGNLTVAEALGFGGKVMRTVSFLG